MLQRLLKHNFGRASPTASWPAQLPLQTCLTPVCSHSCSKQSKGKLGSGGQRAASVRTGASGGHRIEAVDQAQGAEKLPFFCHFPLDRKSEWRKDSAKLAELLADSSTCVFPLYRDQVLVHRQGSQLLPYIIQPGAAEFVAKHASGPDACIFMGVDAAGAAYFGCIVDNPEAAIQDAVSISQSSSLEWMSGRSAGQELQQGDAALLAAASGLAQWHSKERFHPVTGAETVASSGGYSRSPKEKPEGRVPSLYPRLDPAVIMLVTSGRPAAPQPVKQQQQGQQAGGQRGPEIVQDDWCLLGRKAAWPPGRYSTLAGFLEVGEPLEVAVTREVEEESGVRVDLSSVSYNSSQPWPFPKSLMLAFRARAMPMERQRGSSSSSSSPPPPQGYELLSNQGRRAAMDVGLKPHEVSQVLLPQLPPVRVDKEELEDCRWFHREWMLAALSSQLQAEQQQLQQQGQSPESQAWFAPSKLALGPAMLGPEPFQIPGPWSLANRLIKGWLKEHPLEPWAGEDIPEVSIDQGVFKYVLLRVYEGDKYDGRSKLLVWGNKISAYHMDVFAQAKKMAVQRGLKIEALGGGRIEHYREQGVINIFGYSSAFGAAPHEVSATLIRKWHPFYDPECVTVSYSGY